MSPARRPPALVPSSAAPASEPTYDVAALWRSHHALEERVRALEAARMRDLEGRGAAAAPVVATRADHEAGERARIVAALEAARWNKLAAAAAIGMPRRTFYRRLREYGIE